MAEESDSAHQRGECIRQGARHSTWRSGRIGRGGADRWMYYARFKGEVQRDRTALEGEKASSIYCACFGAKVVEGSDHTSEGKRQISSPRFLRRKRTEIGSYRN